VCFLPGPGCALQPPTATSAQRDRAIPKLRVSAARAFRPVVNESWELPSPQLGARVLQCAGVCSEGWRGGIRCEPRCAGTVGWRGTERSWRQERHFSSAFLFFLAFVVISCWIGISLVSLWVRFFLPWLRAVLSNVFVLLVFPDDTFYQLPFFLFFWG